MMDDISIKAYARNSVATLKNWKSIAVAKVKSCLKEKGRKKNTLLDMKNWFHGLK